jgi:adenylate cyclase
VNLASRLESANKVYNSRCLVSEATAKMCAADFDVREIDRVVVTGLSQPQTIYQIMGRKDALSPQQRQLCAHYAAGLAAYRARRWDEARAAFSTALKAMPEDGPSIALLARVENLSRNPPPVDWDGSWHMESK